MHIYHKQMSAWFPLFSLYTWGWCGKNSNLFLSYSRFLLPSFLISLLLLLILLSLSSTLHVHDSLFSTEITRRRSGLRFWLSASFSLSSTCFFFDSTRKKTSCKKEQGCDNTYSINIWDRQQADSFKKMTREKQENRNCIISSNAYIHMIFQISPKDICKKEQSNSFFLSLSTHFPTHDRKKNCCANDNRWSFPEC